MLTCGIIRAISGQDGTLKNTINGALYLLPMGKGKVRREKLQKRDCMFNPMLSPMVRVPSETTGEQDSTGKLDVPPTNIIFQRFISNVQSGYM